MICKVKQERGNMVETGGSGSFPLTFSSILGLVDI